MQASEGKGFPRSDWSWNRAWGKPPKIGRNTLIFWNCGEYGGNDQTLQTIQQKLLMPHPNECGRKRRLDRATTAKKH